MPKPLFRLLPLLLSLTLSTHAQVTHELKTSVKTAPESPQTHQALIQATQSSEPTTQQQAWLLFKGIQSQQTNQHLIQAIHNLSDRAQEHPAAIEILEVAKTFLDPEVKDALNKYQRSHSVTDPLTKFLPALHGGNPATGEQVFTAQCAICHATDHLASLSNTGPNLAGIATRTNHLRKTLLEAIMIPDADITEGFGTVTVEFENGYITGPILAYQPAGIIVQVGETPQLISHSDYTSLRFSASAMPSMKDKLTLRETRDLLAYLDTLTAEKGKPAVAHIHAEPFDHSDIIPHDSAKEIPLAEKQKQLYQMNCMACHQAEGEGNETFPPLAQSQWVSGDKETLIKMQLLGLTGPITVRGKVYDSIAMPSNARINDTDLAHILTYIRTTPSWGNNSSPITPEEVANVRKQLTDTTTPLDATTLPQPEARNPAETQAEETAPQKESNTPNYLIIIAITALLTIAVRLLRKKYRS